MSIVTITPNSESTTSIIEIDTQGASIARLKLKDTDIIWSGIRPDGGKGITHPCIPNFNIADGLPNHGPARKEEWTQISENSFSWIMKAIDELYPSGIEATRKFELTEKSLHVTTMITNTSLQDLPINIAEHHYFPCDPSERGNVTVNGIPFDKGGLEANANYLPIGGKDLRIEIPHLPTIVMAVEGYSAFAQWSQPDASFVCVEPIQVLPLDPNSFMRDAPRIKAGETKEFSYIVKVL